MDRGLERPRRNSVGLYFAAVQFFFVTTWTVYVIFLPQLAAQAGIAKEWVIFLLMADQLIFAVMDLSMGMAADRVVKQVGRLGNVIVWLTGVSCLTFLLLPLIAPAGSPLAFIVVTVVWSISSSALRAPPMVMLGKYVPKSSIPWVSSLMLVGLGVAGASAPYLTTQLRGLDPRVPFALSSIALMVAVSGMFWAERNLSREAIPERSLPAKVNRETLLFFCAVILLALGFQIHSSLNAAPSYLRFATASDLETLLPVFWIGFNLIMFPASRATARFGGLTVMATGAVIGAVAAGLIGSAWADSLVTLVILQFIAGGAWGVVLMSAVAAAIEAGHTGREGAATGGLFSLLAVATLGRMALVASQLNKDPQISSVLPSLPALMWLVAGLLLAVAVFQARNANAARLALVAGDTKQA